MGLKQLSKLSGEYLLEVIMHHYDNKSTFPTSNRPQEEQKSRKSNKPATAGAAS